MTNVNKHSSLKPYSSEQRIKDYERLFSILQSISSTLQVDEILKQILRETLALCGADQGSIVLLQEETTDDPMTIIRHGESRESMIDHYLNTLISGWIIHHKTHLITNDLEETFGNEQVKSEYRNILSLLGVPIVIHERILGILSIISRDRSRIFGEREIKLLNLISTSCAQLIINAQLHETYYNEARRLRNELEDKFSLHGIIGKSPKMAEIFSILERIMNTEARVLLEGESGTGKELIARILHYESTRKTKSFVAIDCGAIPHNLFESELFGYVKGAYTGADRNRKGIMEEAHEGTLFLDEITNMPLDIQSKFLRALQEKEFRPIGSNRIVKIDVQLIAAASVNVRSLIKDGKFREDLYYRLNVINIVLPPLRERKEDISILANHFLISHSKKYGKNIKGIKPDTIDLFESYNWPGNIRELENVIERMVVLSANDDEYLSTELIPIEIRYHDTSTEKTSGVYETIKTSQMQNERKIILDALVENKWNQSAAARLLGISEGALRYKLKKYNLK
jgi:Nif-specific regulatory protein